MTGLPDLMMRERRASTGPHKADPHDWTGYFIRGDDVELFQQALRLAAESTTDKWRKSEWRKYADDMSKVFE